MLEGLNFEGFQACVDESLLRFAWVMVVGGGGAHCLSDRMDLEVWLGSGSKESLMGPGSYDLFIIVVLARRRIGLDGKGWRFACPSPGRYKRSVSCSLSLSAPYLGNIPAFWSYC